MALRDTGKERAAHIALDYFKRPDRMGRWKRVSVVLAIVSTFSWCAAGYWRTDRGVSRYSHGPLAEVHATWESECQACHIAFRPLSADAWKGWPSKTGEYGNARCHTCHDGPAHHENQRAEDVPSCAGCHRDHRGREASLVRLSDAYCTRCHADIDGHRRGASVFDPPLRPVTSFHRDHPDFRSTKSDPGKLKFSHRRHLQPGMVRGHDDEAPPWALADLPEEARARYRRPGQDDNAPIQLDCASCHQTNGADVGASQITGIPAAVLGQHSAGAYMLPVTYEIHCRDCHPLAAEPGFVSPRADYASPDLIPHRQSPEQIREFLENRAAGQYLLRRKPQLLDQPFRAHPLPGEADDSDRDTARQWLDNTVAKWETHARMVCGKCHESAPSDDARLVTTAPTEVPQVWLKHARFDHRAHRAVSCRECHPGAYSDDAEDSSDVLIPGIETCRMCHAPRQEIDGTVRGGARYDCGECHRYHHAENPELTLGSPARGAGEERSIEQFLSNSAAEP